MFCEWSGTQVPACLCLINHRQSALKTSLKFLNFWKAGTFFATWNYRTGTKSSLRFLQSELENVKFNFCLFFLKDHPRRLANLDQQVCFSPGERLELCEVSPASSLRLCSTPSWAVPPCWGLGCCSPSRVPEICCPAWTWKQDKKRLFWTKTGVYFEGLFIGLHDIWMCSVGSCCPLIYLYLMCSAQSPHPHQIQIHGPAPCLRSPCCSWSFPLRFGRPQTWKRGAMDRSWGKMKGLTDRNAWCTKECNEGTKNPKTSSGLPCSGFSLCCIVHLLLLPNVFFFFSIIKLAYPLFTAGFKSSHIGLCTNRHLNEVIILSATVTNRQVINMQQV